MYDFKKHSLYKPMEVDSVISTVFTIYLKNFFKLFLFTFLTVLLVQYLFYSIGFYEVMKTFDPEYVEGNLGYFFKLMGKILIISVLAYGILNTFLINYLFVKDIDPNASVGSILGESISKFTIHMIFFMILTSFIMFFGMMLGIIVFVIGILLAAIYFGTVLVSGCSIIVVEQKNAFDAIGRSFSLTHKDFWQAVGSLVLFVLILILISMVLSAIIAIPFVIMFFGNLNDTKSFLEAFNLNIYELGIWQVVLNSIVSALTFPLYAIFSLVLYFKLKYTEDQKAIFNNQ